jgi:A118 family predicted phage portal protein
LNILQRMKGWWQSLFNFNSKIIEDTSINLDYYNDYIAYWKSLYQCESETVSFTNPDGNTRSRTKKNMRLTKLIAEELASLVFSENTIITVDDEILNEYVQSVLEENDYLSKKSDLIEMMFGLGGSVEKIYRVNDKTKINYVTADNFIPTEWNHNKITSGIFLTYSEKNKYRYTLVEKHKYDKKARTMTIESELYKSTNQSYDNSFGSKTKLSELYPDIQEVVLIKNVSQPFFSYCKPAIANNIDLDTPLGISVFENCRDTIDILNTCFDSWDREFKLGKKRILVPANMIKTRTLTNGEKVRYFDSDEDVFKGLNDDGTTDNNIKDNTQELRVEEHIATINALLNYLCIQLGLTVGSLSFDARGGLKTATEVISENSKTFRTKRKHERAIESNIKEVITSIIEIGMLYEDIGVVDDYEIDIKFDDSIITDLESARQKDYQDVLSGLLSKKTYLVKHKNLSEEDADKELEAISSESSGSLFTAE